MDNKKKVPALRFPEFSGEWKVKKINQVGDVVTGSTPETKYPEYYNGDNIFVSPADIQGNRFVKKTNTTLTDLGLSKGRLVKKDSVLFVCIGSTIGKVAQASKICITNQQINSINIHSNFSNDFLYSLLYFKSKNIKVLAGKQAVPIINKTTFSKIELFFPKIEEQQKIAYFLTKIDIKIEKLSKKKQLLDNYKKGVMQNIFNYEVRFIDKGKSELRTGQLKDFGYFYYGKSAPKWSVTNEAKTPCIRYGELYSTYKEHIKNIKSYTNINPDNLKFSKGGEILVPRVGEDPLDFANCSYLPIENVAIGEMISVYNTEENGLFITYYINTMLKNKFARVVEGANVSNLYFKYLENIEIIIPSIEEQTKIADFLTKIDDKINLVEKQLNDTKNYKKGLLQQMFV